MITINNNILYGDHVEYLNSERDRKQTNDRRTSFQVHDYYINPEQQTEAVICLTSISDISKILKSTAEIPQLFQLLDITFPGYVDL